MKILKSHFGIFEFFGVWEPPAPSALYRLWQWISLIVTGIGLPFTFLMSIIYADDPEAMLKIPVLMCTILSVTIKCVLIVSKRTKIDDLLDTMSKMDRYVEASTEKLMENAFKKIRRLHMAFKVSYYGAYTMVLAEFISKGGTNLFWQSTMQWPWQWAHSPSIYFTILALQVATNAINCVLAVLTDTLASILCILLDGHLSVLEFKLRRLGYNDESSGTSQDVKELINCIEYHDLCVR